MSERNLNISFMIVGIVLVGTVIYALGQVGVLAVIIATGICWSGMKLMRL